MFIQEEDQTRALQLERMFCGYAMCSHNETVLYMMRQAVDVGQLVTGCNAVLSFATVYIHTL